MTPRTGVLLLAYGTPERPEDVEPYFTHIRGGRRPSPEAVEHLKARYELVGGRTPLLDTTCQLASSLEVRLASDADVPVFVAMKHWHPFIADVVPEIAATGVERIVAIVLAPHYSRMSIGAYRRALQEASARLPRPLDVTFIDQWHVHPAFIAMVANQVLESLRTFPPGDGPVLTLFSAHSLPVRIREWNDPYEAQLLESCQAVASRVGLSTWRFAWQSAGQTGEPWLGPDILDALDALSAEGVRRVLSVPIGFLSEHLEVLYDIDHEARGRADSLGMTLRRVAMPNASGPLVDTLAALVAEARRGTIGASLALREETVG